jgi:glycerophosphoryl diester phosphodiesterase
MQLVAHRGNALDCPENTLTSLSSALELGARWLELDVQLSRDQLPIVIHDHELLRTTGTPGQVFDRTAVELCALPAGEPGRFGARFAEVRLPLLTEAVALIRATPDAQLFVEIKSESLKYFGHRLVLDRVLEVLAGCGPQFIVISFDYRAVELARRIGGVPIGWVLKRYDEASRQRLQRLAPEFVFCNHEKFAPGAAPWPGSWRWASYEVRDPGLARDLHARGVELIETMAVRDMRAALAAELAPAS